MKSIDIKSLLIGILGTALVMVLMGQASSNEQMKLLIDAVKYDVECVQDYQTTLGGDTRETLIRFIARCLM